MEPSVAVVHPAHAVHVVPRPVRQPRLLVRSEAKDVAVGVLDLHLAGPGVVRGWMADLCALRAQLVVQRHDVAYADPDPGGRISLIAHAEKDVAAPARDRGEEVAGGEVDFEAEDGGVVVETRNVAEVDLKRVSEAQQFNLGPKFFE